MDPSDAAAALAAEYNSIFIANHCANAAAVLFIYEYLITIGEEAKYFWQRNLTGASAVFFLNRYVPLAWYALGFASYAGMSDRRFANLCARLGKFYFGYGILQYVFWAAFSGSRAFALTNRSWIMLFLVSGLSLTPVVVNLIPAHYGVSGDNVPLTGCVEDDMTPPDVAKRKGAFRVMFGTATFADVLLRDGTIYFVVLVVLNVLHLAFSLASFAVPALQNASDITAFTEPITAILVQRFLFHLQSANRQALDMGSSQSGSAIQRESHSLVFDRVIGSLGASIPPEDFLGTSEGVEDELEGEVEFKSEDI